MRVLKKSLWPYSIDVPLRESEVDGFLYSLIDSGTRGKDWAYHFIGSSGTVKVYSKERELITLLKLRYNHATE